MSNQKTSAPQNAATAIAERRGLNVFKRGVIDVISEPDLIDKLNRKERLLVKFGIDPTTPDMHLGHTVPLTKLRQLQELGHKCVLIVGDFTATIGDPSGKKVTRPRLTYAEVKKNLEGYKAQLAKIVDISQIEVLYNSDWLNAFKPFDFLDLLSRYTVQQLLQRRDFAIRMSENSPLTVTELIYPIMVGYDSVVIKSDVEIGGTDQLFNFMISRDIQKAFGQEGEVILTLPLLEGVDGKLKMSKSYGNAINVEDGPQDMFMKIMSINDETMVKYYELVSLVDLDKLEAIKRGIQEKTTNPIDPKMDLAFEIAERYHGTAAAEGAKNYFNTVIRKKGEAEEHLAELVIPAVGKIPILELLRMVEPEKSNNQFWRLIEQGAVSINSTKVLDPKTEYEVAGLDGAVIRVGKKAYRKIKLGSE